METMKSIRIVATFALTLYLVSYTDCKGQLLYIAQQMSLNHVNTFYTIVIQNNYKTICIQNTKANTMKTAFQCNIELKSEKTVYRVTNFL